jgi:ABC-2 type transport system permease protein
MNLRIIRTLMVKDLKEVRMNKGAWVPAVVVPLIFMVLLPGAVILVPTRIPAVSQALVDPNGLGQVLTYVAPFMGDRLAGLDSNQTWVVLTTGYMLAPFLLIMPLMLATIIGAESFVGEKERKTLEALIYTPARDSELFLGKVLASVLPAVGLAWISFILYGIVANLAAWPVMGRIWFPTLTWWPLMLWLAPAIATMGMAVTVLISIRAKTFMEAYQMSGSLVILVLALLAGQISGILFLSVGVSLLLGTGIWLVDGILIWIGVRTFARSSLIGRI